MRIESDRYRNILGEMAGAMKATGVNEIVAGVSMDPNDGGSPLLDMDAKPDCADGAWSVFWEIAERFLVLLEEDLGTYIERDAPYSWPVWGDVSFTLSAAGYVVARDDSLHANAKGSLSVGVRVHGDSVSID